MRALLSVSAVCLTIVAAACGKSDPSGLSHEELVKRTNAACTGLDERMSKVEEPENADSYVEFVEGAHDAVRKAGDELGKLRPQAGDSGSYNRLTDTYDQLERTLAELVKAAHAEQPYVIERLSSRVDRLVTSSHRIAGELGAKACTT
jgi:hypothetical protein